MAKSHIAAAVFALTLVSGAAVAADVPQRPGKWEVSMQMDMPGMPFKMPAIKTQVCVTEEDLKDPNKSVPKDQNSKDCKVSDYKVDGNTVTWKMVCTGKTKGEGEGEMTYSGDSYEGKMVFNMEGTEMTTKYKGKFLGECKK